MSKKWSAWTMTHTRGANVEPIDIDLGGALSIRITVGGQVFDLRPTDDGLQVRTYDGRLNVQPEASNTVVLREKRHE